MTMKTFTASILPGTESELDALFATMKTREQGLDRDQFNRIIVEHGHKILDDIVTGRLGPPPLGAKQSSPPPSPLGLGTKK